VRYTNLFIIIGTVRVHASVRRPSVRLSVPSGRLKPAAGLLLWARRPGNIDRLLHDWRAGDQQQPHRSTARSSKCEEYQVNVS